MNFLLQLLVALFTGAFREWLESRKIREDAFQAGAKAAEENATKQSLEQVKTAHETENYVRSLPLDELREQLRAATKPATNDNDQR